MLQRVAKLILNNAVFSPGLIFSTLVLILPEHYLLGGLGPPFLRDRVFFGFKAILFSNGDGNISLSPLPMKLISVCLSEAVHSVLCSTGSERDCIRLGASEPREGWGTAGKDTATIALSGDTELGDH